MVAAQDQWIVDGYHSANTDIQVYAHAVIPMNISKKHQCTTLYKNQTKLQLGARFMHDSTLPRLDTRFDHLSYTRYKVQNIGDGERGGQWGGKQEGCIHEGLGIVTHSCSWKFCGVTTHYQNVQMHTEARGFP